MNKILIIEDEAELLDSLQDFLNKERYCTKSATDLNTARAQLTHHPDLILLDWMLPDGDGVDFVKELRSQGNPVPIILLTARNELIDRVLGLELGANDYITKPFSPRELLARIRVQLRTPFEKKATLNTGPIHLDCQQRKVTYFGREISLVNKEYELLKYFLENPNQVFSREELLNRVWGYDNYPTTRTIDTHILQLRQKFDESYFETVRGVGYRLNTKNLQTIEPALTNQTNTCEIQIT